MKKILLPGILAGIAVFVWSFISHMVLPLGEVGVKAVPANDDVIVSAMKSNITEPGFYMLPGIDMKTASAEQQTAWQAKWKAGPAAIVVYNPTGWDAMSPWQLIRQLLFQILCGLIAAFTVSLTVASLANRTVMVMLMGVFAWLTVNVPQWNWYGFPSNFTLAQGADHLIAWLIGGLVIAWMIGRTEKK
ncbi:MAG: hypothetical protein SF097_04675 [Acidobacteriota bacterium]|nr:hypothetical protein [Acidobacteriota bacterium]